MLDSRVRVRVRLAPEVVLLLASCIMNKVGSLAPQVSQPATASSVFKLKMVSLEKLPSAGFPRADYINFMKVKITSNQI